MLGDVKPSPEAGVDMVSGVDQVEGGNQLSPRDFQKNGRRYDLLRWGRFPSRHTSL